MTARPLLAWLFVALVSAACAEPPNKEMDQAQGAIDAARAAGADRYATAELEAATASLSGATVAVSQRDYRLALNHALESREHAQNAARSAAETRARLRGELERSLAELTALLAGARVRLEAATRNRASARTVTAATEALAAAEVRLQEAGKALGLDDYGTAGPALQDLRGQIEKAVDVLDAPASQAPRRRG